MKFGIKTKSERRQKMGTVQTPDLPDEDSIEKLLEWYRAEKRDLPWRKTKDPYCIWISEIMLQQTRVEAVKPYYHAFLKALPDVSALACAPEQKLMKLWEGLGYYSRARNLQKAAKTVMEEYGGVMPNRFAELKKLSGIGDYTAGAIASIAFGERVPAVDGNVLRVLSRFCGDEQDITLPQTKAYWNQALSPCIPADAGDFTQAMIELGATVCVPNGEAKCGICPLAEKCRAKKMGLTGVLPIRGEKKPRKIRDLTVLLIRDGSRTAVHQREKKGLLAGLWELPNLPGHLNESEIPEKLRELGFDPLRVVRLEDAKHIFTHVEWHMIAYAVQISPEFDGYHPESGYVLAENRDLHDNYPIPSAFGAYTKFL